MKQSFRHSGIMLTDIIPALICRPTKEDSFPGKSCVFRGVNMSGGQIPIQKIVAEMRVR